MQRAGGAGLERLRSLRGRYAPNGRGRIALRAGCLLFAPFITLFVWLVQGMIWMVISAPILAYALLMASLGGGFSRGHRLSAGP